MITTADSRALAEWCLADLPRRWRHVQGVGHQAEHVAEALRLPDGALVAAAWLHDIGYAPRLASTGFHPLDGARFLRHKGAGDRLASLVAHHSCAVHEARVRGLEEVLLAEFEREDSPTYDALVLCDLTTGPDGEQLTSQARMDEIEQRYGPAHEVTRALDLARADLAGCCERTLALVAAAQVS